MIYVYPVTPLPRVSPIFGEQWYGEGGCTDPPLVLRPGESLPPTVGTRQSGKGHPGLRKEPLAGSAPSRPPFGTRWTGCERWRTPMAKPCTVRGWMNRGSDEKIRFFLNSKTMSVFFWWIFLMNFGYWLLGFCCEFFLNLPVGIPPHFMKSNLQQILRIS